MPSRLAAYIEDVQCGRVVRFRPTGHSMTPRIKSGELVTVAPYPAGEDPLPGEVVLCRVKGREVLHLIKAVRQNEYLIGNNNGGINGWTPRTKIYGRMIRVEP